MELDVFIDENRLRMIDDIIALVNIPSVWDAATQGPGQPFGIDTKRALEFLLNRAESMGMQVKNYDGYVGEITVGEGSFMLGVLAHVDVVAAGEGWGTPAFTGVVQAGKLFGRGSSDDKGPLISSLYAIKYLMETQKLPAWASIRLIIGTNEEEDWKCMEYYKQKADRFPDYSIVPDGYFPLIYCEKGLLDLDISIPVQQNKQLILRQLSGGSGRNVVAGNASCLLECPSATNAIEIASQLSMFEGIYALAQGKTVQVKSEGVSVHAMTPEKGISAIGRLMKALGCLDALADPDNFVQRYNHYIGMNYHGEQLGCDRTDDLSGRTTFSVGVMRLTGDYLELEVSLRYPSSLDQDEILDAMRKSCQEAGFSLSKRNVLLPVYRDPESEFVKKLLEVYRKVTGDMDSEPFSIGGATYARVLPNAVAFGPLFPYETELAHMPNEFLSIDSLEQMTRIYAQALEALLTMKHNVEE